MMEVPSGERVLVNARDTTTGRHVAATRYALYHQDSPREWEPWHRLAWEHIERVDWDDARAALTFIGRARNLTLRLAGNRKLLDLARERIAATTLLHVPLSRSGQPAGWLSARRGAGGNGEVSWVLHPADIDLTDAEVALAIRNARVQSGL